MTLPASGAVSLSAIQGEFGGAASPIALGNYYRGGANVPVGTTAGTTGVQIATSGALNVNDFHGTTAHVPFSTKVAFTATGTWTVPVGVTTARVKVWGAAGNNNTAGSGNLGSGGGGSGGYAQADITVTPGNTIQVSISSGGTVSQTTVTGVFDTSISQANARVIAGNGGGAGGSIAAAASVGGLAGGGSSGNGGAGGAGNGGPGTQVGGGAAGTASGGTTNVNGGAGTALAGGAGASSSRVTPSPGNGSGGGGGAGYWGGGGGGATGAAGGGAGYGGGGGSGFVTGSNTTNTLGNNGVIFGVANPPNTGDADYVAGKGASDSTANNTSGAGYIVIAY